MDLLDASSRTFTCPACWSEFDAGDVYSVARHESLRGDPILGEDAHLRFLPVRFDDLSHAIDPMGLPTSEMACPQCRRTLPPSFLQVRHHILSLVGAPSSGKSYYLSILIKKLGDALSRYFELSLSDADPTGNVLLNQMKNRLFSAESPLDAVLAKTALEGSMYERFPRNGKWVSLPRPFVYRVGQKDKPQDSQALVFYDNAGEHFEPGIDTDDSPGAMHVANSSALFFLFDPTANTHFRHRLSQSDDPQITQKARLDQQDSILAEMELRVKKILGIPIVDKIKKPLFFIVGKADVLKPLLPFESFEAPYANGKLDATAIRSNSEKMREFLLSIDPALVRQVEQFADEVYYFPVSAFGHAPVRLMAAGRGEMLAPDPKRLDPWMVEIPALWFLQRVLPDAIKTE